MNVTTLIGLLFRRRERFLKSYHDDAEALQQHVLRRLTNTACNTEWGISHGYHSINSYEQFAATSAIHTYDDLKPYIERMRRGESDVLWPGRVRWFAKSSGTTNDKSKFIPVTQDCLRDTHYAGGTDCVVTYLATTGHSRIFDGKALILGGSHAPNYDLPGTRVGDLSAILIENVNPLIHLVRVPDKKTALLPDFEEKRERIAQAALHKDVTSLSGVPSWMLSVLTRVLELSGEESLDSVWPNLEVFWHGGVAFTPYREQYHRLIPSQKMHYVETYNASEGFFGIQDDPDDEAMLLMIDYGVFFEFLPMEDLDSKTPQIVPLWGVETGRNYAMVISTSGGLWRYMLGDTVRFTSTRPYKFVITGRTKFYINAFGEELIVDNAEHALAEVCESTGTEVLEYTAAPIFMDGKAHCRHQWLIEFSRPPADVEDFAEQLDKALQRQNSDYEAKRAKNITLQRLQIIVARHDLFNDWLREHGKLGGQHKVPRLSNSRETMDELLKLNAGNGMTK